MVTIFNRHEPYHELDTNDFDGQRRHYTVDIFEAIYTMPVQDRSRVDLTLVHQSVLHLTRRRN